jgi:hypothetical protein
MMEGRGNQMWSARQSKRTCCGYSLNARPCPHYGFTVFAEPDDLFFFIVAA